MNHKFITQTSSIIKIKEILHFTKIVYYAFFFFVEGIANI